MNGRCFVIHFTTYNTPELYTTVDLFLSQLVLHVRHTHTPTQSNCAVIPLVGDEPLSLVDSFKRVWQLLSAGLFLPGSIGIPDPCEVRCRLFSLSILCTLISLCFSSTLVYVVLLFQCHLHIAQLSSFSCAVYIMIMFNSLSLSVSSMYVSLSSLSLSVNTLFCVL